MRRIKYIVVHCTATPQSATIAAIVNFWQKVKGWKSPGYHIIVKPDGTATRLASDESITNGVAGYNSQSLHVCYIGGVDAKGKPIDNRTESQKATMLLIIRDWKNKHPNAHIMGHRNFAGVNKACPSFDAKSEYSHII